MINKDKEKNRLTIPEVAEKLRCSYITVYRMVREGELPARKVGGKWLIVAKDIERI